MGWLMSLFIAVVAVFTKTEEEKTVYELQYKSLSGKLVGVKIDTTGDYGTQMKLTIRDGEDFIFAVPLNNGWGQKIAEAIPNINTDEDVFFNAYGDFTTDDNKEVKAGVSMKQNGEKVQSHFNKYDEKKKVWNTTNDFPEIVQDDIPAKTNKAKYTKFWQDHFFTIGEFLAEYIEKNYSMEVVPAPIPDPEEEAF